tara:strand:+ start:213 stop:581 length:369 start_codon:yes stop_codon:yes gene_type:complete
MKKILTLFFVFFAFESIAVEKKTTFNFDVFKEAQNSGKTVVVSSWNKYCGTCTQQTKILDQAKKKFPNIIFLSYEQKHKKIADFLKIDYWATIAIYKNNKEINRALGITSKEDIYSLINQGV